MNRLLYTLALIFTIAFSVNAQELNARFTVNSDNIPGSNKQVFKTLERELTDFVNQKKWTDTKYKTEEKIDCAFTLIILEQPSANEFKGTLQIQAARPVYNSTYLTPILNFKDDDFTFNYIEFQNLVYNQNRFESNLISIMAYYAYVILGIDGDSFATRGGTESLKLAENAMNQAAQSGFSGWTSQSSGVTRYKLMNELLSPANNNFRTAIYQYHSQGLDLMKDQTELAKKNIDASINKLTQVYNRRPNSVLIRIFMDAKSEEIVNIFSAGPKYDASKLVDVLNRIYPSNSQNWEKIK